MNKLPRYLSFCACAVLAITALALAADLGDDPEAMKKRPDYVPACKKLAADIAALPDWVEPMKKVHAKFKGTPGVFCCWGDSITQQAEYWKPLKNGGKNMDPALTQAYTLIKGYMKPECWDWKGSKYGNEGGKTSLWGQENVDKWLKEYNPECMILLFGANDQDRPDQQDRNVQLEDCMKATEEIVSKSLDNGTVVIMCTMAPRKNRRCDIYSERMIKIAAKYHIPVCDYLGAIIQRRPTDWDGSLDQFAEFHMTATNRAIRFEAPTLISGDGEHPSHPKATTDDYSEEALKINGCSLHTYVTALSYADVIHKVFGVPLPPATKPAQ